MHQRKSARDRMTDLTFKISHADREALADLAERTKVPSAEVVRTGVKIMLERARVAGLIPREALEEQNDRAAPPELATPALRAV